MFGWRTKGAARDISGEEMAISKAVNSSQAAIWFDPSGIILDANANFLATVGYELDEIKGQHHRMFVDKDMADSDSYARFWSRLQNGETFSDTFSRVGKSGARIWLEASYNPILGADGKVVKIVKLAMDVTQARKRDADLESQIAAISRSQAVIEFETDGTILTANDNFLATMGYQLEDIVGKHHRIFVDPQEAGHPDYATFWTELAAGQFKGGEFCRKNSKGDSVWIQATYNPIFDSSGKIYKVIKFASDITRQKLRSADVEGQFETVQRSQAVIEFDPRGNILTANENFLSAMGYELDEIRGRHHEIFVDPDYATSTEYRTFWKDLAEGAYRSGEFERFGKNGKPIWIQAVYAGVRGPDGQVCKVVKVARDVTDRVEAMREFQDGLDGISRGDLSVRIPDSVEGDFEQLRNSFNTSVELLRDMVSGIQTSAADVASESDVIARLVAEQSGRNERQAAAFEETSATMEEMASSVSSTAANCKGASSAAHVAEDHARRGGEDVSQAVAAMQQIEESSNAIANIVEVIEAISFQTNLLALNAGVEAARAGSAGQGFSVVASEVRALAQRASDSAQEISTLIGASQVEVSKGSGLVNQSGQSLSDIVSSVTAVVGSIRDISTASSEQATGISEVNRAIHELSATVQQSAAASEESAAVAGKLANNARELRSLVEFFRTDGRVSEGQVQTPPLSKAS